MKPLRSLKLLWTNKAQLGVYLIALWKLFKHPGAPKLAKGLAVAVIAYAVSPIDLIPDFIPVLGLLDDLVLIPLGIALVVRLTPKPLWQQLLQDARDSHERLPQWRWGAVAIVVFWVLVFGALAWWVFGRIATA